MEKVASYASLEKAEAAGEMLIRYGLSPRIEGSNLFVAAEDAEKARTLLGIAEEEEERQRTEPFHPCPKCNTADPIWFGKRKIILLMGIIVGSIVVGRFVSPQTFWAALGVAFVVLLVGFFRIPEYECRRCGHRWTREPRTEPDLQLVGVFQAQYFKFLSAQIPSVEQLRALVEKINNEKTFGLTSSSVHSREIPLEQIVSAEHRKSGLFGRGLHLKLSDGKKMFFRFLKPESENAAQTTLATVLNVRYAVR